MLRKVSHVVHVAKLVELEHRVAIDKRQFFLGNKSDTGNYFAPVQRLIFSSDHSLFDQLRHSSRDNLGLHAEVLLLSKECGHCRSYGPDPDLNGVPIVDQLRRHQRADHLCHQVLFIRARRHGHGPRGLLRFAQSADL